MQQIRKELHFTQQELALLLGVSRSTIALCEAGLRTLPVKAITKWERLHHYWQQSLRHQLPAPRPAASPYLLKQSNTLFQLKARMQRAAARSVAISQQLTKMENRHRRLGLKLFVINSLIQESDHKREMQLLVNRSQLTQMHLANCCPLSREMLQFKLRLLNAEQKAALSSSVIVQQDGNNVNHSRKQA